MNRRDYDLADEPSEQEREAIAIRLAEVRAEKAARGELGLTIHQLRTLYQGLKRPTRPARHVFLPEPELPL